MINLQQSLSLQSFLQIRLIRNYDFLGKDASVEPNNYNVSTVVVNKKDQVSLIFDITGLYSSQFKLIYKGNILCPALSFAFYNICNNDTIIVVNSQKNNYSSIESTNDHLTYFSLIDNVLSINSDKKNKSDVDPMLCHQSSINILEDTHKSSFNKQSSTEKETLNMDVSDRTSNNNSNYNMQSYHDSMKPITAHESARLIDLYRSRIESNTKSFRKLCAKYRILMKSDSFCVPKRVSSSPNFQVIASNSATSDKQCKNSSSSMETILPEKPSFPSTDLLPTFTSFDHF